MKKATGIPRWKIEVTFLKWVYLLALVVVIAVVVTLHTTPRPLFDVLRLPTFFRTAEPALGVSYVTSMTIYHFTFAYFLLVMFIDMLSLFLYQNKFLRKISLLSSFFGFFIIGFMFLYFFYSFAVVGSLQTISSISAFLFLMGSTIFFLLDLVTFLVEEQEIYLFE